MSTAILVLVAIAAVAIVMFAVARKRGSARGRDEHARTDVTIVPLEEPMATGLGTRAPEPITHRASDNRRPPPALPR